MLEGHVAVGQSQRIGCVWKPGFVKFGHIICISFVHHNHDGD